MVIRHVHFASAHLNRVFLVKKMHCAIKAQTSRFKEGFRSAGSLFIYRYS